MTKLAALFLVLGLLTPVPVATAQPAAQQTRQLSAFQAVDARGSVDVDVRVGGAQSVVVEASRASLARIVTTVRDGTLRISVRGRGRLGPSRVRVVVPRLDALTLNGSGDARIEGARGEALALSSQGSGDIEARGQVRRLTATALGSGDIRASELRAANVSVTSRGSGDLAVRASEGVAGALAGSGDLEVTGDPPARTISRAGSGQVLFR